MRLAVGCAMWSHPDWPGRYLPEHMTPRDRLRNYATWCDAVEGNTTFYATPARETVVSWAEQTPADFRFVLKLPKEVTHERRLRDSPDAFLAAVEPLGPRLHALWVQLPASFGPGDVGELAAFLRRLPAGRRCAVEVRHPAFFSDDRAMRLLERALGAAGAEWVPFDTTAFFAAPPRTEAEQEAWERKPRLPRRTTALTDRPIVRYLDRDGSGWAPWVEAVTGWLREGRSPTIFLHTPDNRSALDLARRFHAAVRRNLPELPDLPEPVSTGTLF